MLCPPAVLTADDGTYRALLACAVMTLTLTVCPGRSALTCLLRASVTP